MGLEAAMLLCRRSGERMRAAALGCGTGSSRSMEVARRDIRDIVVVDRWRW